MKSERPSRNGRFDSTRTGRYDRGHSQLRQCMKLLSLRVGLVLMLAPMSAVADKAPGYESYPDNHVGYLGDGIVGEGEDEAAEMARAVPNPTRT